MTAFCAILHKLQVKCRVISPRGVIVPHRNRRVGHPLGQLSRQDGGSPYGRAMRGAHAPSGLFGNYIAVCTH